MKISHWQILCINGMVTKSMLLYYVYDILPSLPAAKLGSMSPSFASSKLAEVWMVKPFSRSSSDPASSPSIEGILLYLSRTFGYFSCLL